MSMLTEQPPPRDLPSLRMLAQVSSARSLPVWLTSFIGRAQQIADVQELLDRNDVRLLTIAGMGGVGKTRLAARSVESLDGFAAGVWFVSLESCRDPVRVPTIIAGVLGIPPGVTQTAEQELASYLAEGRSLLVLDNVEHVPGAGTFLAELLAACPGLKVLATSRSPLGVSGEHVYRLQPLAVPDPEVATSTEDLATNDTVALFVARAQASSAGFAITVDTADTIAAICQRLEGIPLAIELAAARAGVLPLPLLLRKLEPRLPLLADGPQNAPSRQQTMSSAIAWSYDLLSDDEQRLFRRLGVFVGGFTLEAATAVAGQSEDQVLNGVISLVANSLLNPSTGSRNSPRFTMLETIREFALQKLTANDEDPAVRRIHADYFTAIAEAAIPLYDGPELPVQVDRINDELGNCRVAMEWALANGAYDLAIRLAGAIWRIWFYPQATGERPWRNRLIEGRRWLDRALEHRKGLPVTVLTEALMGAGYLACLQGDLDCGEERGAELFARATAERNDFGTYWAHILLGTVNGAGNRFGDARAHFEKALAVAPAIRDPDNQGAFALMNLAELESQASNPEQAIRRFTEALAYNAHSGNPCITSHCMRGSGALFLARGDYGNAIPLLRQSIVIDRELDQRLCVSESLLHLSRAAASLGDVKRSIRLLAGASRLPIDPDMQAPFSETLARARSDTAEPDFTLAWETGAHASWDDTLTDIDGMLASLASTATGRPGSSRLKAGSLSNRELEVVRLLADGQSNRAIAETLSLSQRTVEHHVVNILAKLGLDSRTAVATYAIRRGLA